MKEENQKLAQRAAEAKAKLGETKARNRNSLLMAAACMSIICGVAWIAGQLLHGVAMAPPPPDPPVQCIESAEVISSDDSVRHCPIGGKLTVEHLGVADKVLVRCHCGTESALDGGT